MKTLLIILFSLCSVYAAEIAQQNKANSQPRYFVGSSAMMIGNLFPEPPSFYQLDLGYRVTREDALILQFITWKYPAPLGIPYWGAFGKKSEYYPGDVRAFGVGIDYQRYLYKELFAMLQIGNFYQIFHDTTAHTENTGYQLFLQGRIGYHFEFWNQRLYMEPSVVCNYWPINTGMPASFQEKEGKWPNYFFPEPGLYFGVQF